VTKLSKSAARLVAKPAANVRCAGAGASGSADAPQPLKQLTAKHLLCDAGSLKAGLGNHFWPILY